MKTNVVTITSVTGRNVSYTGNDWDGCDINQFPDIPEVGDKYEITEELGLIVGIEKLLTNL